METRVRRVDGLSWRGAMGGGAMLRRDSHCTNFRPNAFAGSGGGTGTTKFHRKKHISRSYFTGEFSTSRNFGVSYESCDFSRFDNYRLTGFPISLGLSCGFATGSGRILASLTLPRMATVLFFLCLLLQTTKPTSAAFTTVSTVPDPEFVDEIGNITVPAGRNVKLACSVKDLGSYKVAWMLFDKSAILTVHNHVITRNPRISVSHDKHRTWFLHINNVHEDDKGKYMCQINTATAKTHYGYLHVVVPPDIDDSLSSSDAIVRENANVTLTCKATGSPTPSIHWKRDDNEKITINKTLEVMEWEGETLEMTRISRLGMGAYLCIASNGIPPAVSKQIKVSVDFSPMLSIPHQLVGAPLGYSVTLECHTEAHPTSLNYWTRDEKDPMIHDSKKYKTTTTPEKPSYKTHMTLTIYDIQPEDYGSYKCVAKNPRGTTDGTIRLYESSPPSTSPRPVTTELSRKAWDVLTEMNNSVDGNPSSLTFHNDKGSKQGKSGSHLNEIDKSEQKSGELDRKRNYNWTPENDTATRFATTGTLLILDIIATWIIR